jgi:hypothetical protein
MIVIYQLTKLMEKVKRKIRRKRNNVLDEVPDDELTYSLLYFLTFKTRLYNNKNIMKSFGATTAVLALFIVLTNAK